MIDDRQELLEQLAKKLADDGRLIEAGWIALQRLCIPPDSPDHQVGAMRCAYMAGAQHLFASMVSMLSNGDETDDDVRRMDLIAKEMNDFSDEMQLRLSKTKGSA